MRRPTARSTTARGCPTVGRLSESSCAPCGRCARRGARLGESCNSHKPCGCRRGFTILELLAGIGVIGILMALLIPAVQASREAARRLECTNNLHQFGIAIHGFEAAMGEYPRWQGPLLNDPFKDGYYHFKELSPHAQLLAYLEQQALADHPNLNGGTTWYPRLQSPPENMKLAVFLCPSDPQEFGTNYRGCTGPDPHERHRKDEGGGLFGRLEVTRPKDILDGFGQTVVMSEKRRSSLDEQFDRRTDYWYTGLDVVLPDGGWQVPADEMLSYCEALPPSPASFYPWVGLEWMPSAYSHSLYNHVAPPNSPICDCSIEGSPPNHTIQPGTGGNADQSTGSFAASSWHPGGVNALLADGAVRFVSDDIDLTVWRGLATIAGHEVVGEW